MRISNTTALILLFMSSIAGAQNPQQAAGVSGASASSTSANDLQARLRAALQQQQGRLGELLPWQKILFDQEVLANQQRFIRDYRASSGGVTVDVDLASVKNYLRFHASQIPAAAEGTPPDTRAFVVIKSQKNCEKCIAAEPELKTLLTQRLENRGLKIVWLTPEQLQVSGGKGAAVALDGKALDERATQIMKQNGGAAAVVARMEPLAAEIDSAHADELRYNMHLTLAVKDLPRHDIDLEVLDSGKFENAFIRVITDGFTEIGARQLLTGQQGIGSQVLIEITGFRDFSGYRDLVRTLQEKLGDAEPLVERTVSRSSVTLALRTSRKKEEIKALLGNPGASVPKWEVK